MDNGRSQILNDSPTVAYGQVGLHLGAAGGSTREGVVVTSVTLTEP